MKPITSLLLFLIIPGLSFAQTTVKAPGAGYKPIILNNNYNHNKFGVSPSNLVFQFSAFITSFDSDDDDNGDNKADVWGIPEWVAFEIHPKPSNFKKSSRPTKWMTHDSLNAVGKAPNHNTYQVSGASTRDNQIAQVPIPNSRFVRGHMCPKNAADRLGKAAGYNTHTILNAVPQLQWQNNVTWKYLEQDCEKWADDYKKIWVICGPLFYRKNPSMWLGQNTDVSAAIPDAIFKIVIREDPSKVGGVDVLSFIFPNIIPSDKRNISEYLASIEKIESISGLTFFSHYKKLGISESDLLDIKQRNSENDSARQKRKAYCSWKPEKRKVLTVGSRKKYLCR